MLDVRDLSVHVLLAWPCALFKRDFAIASVRPDFCAERFTNYATHVRIDKVHAHTGILQFYRFLNNNFESKDVKSSGEVGPFEEKRSGSLQTSRMRESCSFIGF